MLSYGKATLIILLLAFLSLLNDIRIIKTYNLVKGDIISTNIENFIRHTKGGNLASSNKYYNIKYSCEGKNFIKEKYKPAFGMWILPKEYGSINIFCKLGDSKRPTFYTEYEIKNHIFTFVLYGAFFIFLIITLYSSGVEKYFN